MTVATFLHALSILIWAIGIAGLTYIVYMLTVTILRAGYWAIWCGVGYWRWRVGGNLLSRMRYTAKFVLWTFRREVMETGYASTEVHGVYMHGYWPWDRPRWRAGMPRAITDDE